MKIKRPVIALILSAVFPGFGQLYNSQITKGIVYIGIKLVINLLRREPLELIVNQFKQGRQNFDSDALIIVLGYTAADIVLWIYSMMDAKKNAEVLEQKRSEHSND